MLINVRQDGSLFAAGKIDFSKATLTFSEGKFIKGQDFVKLVCWPLALEGFKNSDDPNWSFTEPKPLQIRFKSNSESNTEKAFYKILSQDKYLSGYWSGLINLSNHGSLFPLLDNPSFDDKAKQGFIDQMMLLTPIDKLENLTEDHFKESQGSGDRGGRGNYPKPSEQAQDKFNWFIGQFPKTLSHCKTLEDYLLSRDTLKSAYGVDNLQAVESILIALLSR